MSIIYKATLCFKVEMPKNTFNSGSYGVDLRGQRGVLLQFLTALGLPSAGTNINDLRYQTENIYAESDEENDDDEEYDDEEYGSEPEVIGTKKFIYLTLSIRSKEQVEFLINTSIKEAVEKFTIVAEYNLFGEPKRKKETVNTKVLSGGIL